jgi:hypothetical protein
MAGGPCMYIHWLNGNYRTPCGSLYMDPSHTIFVMLTISSRPVAGQILFFKGTSPRISVHPDECDWTADHVTSRTIITHRHLILISSRLWIS